MEKFYLLCFPSLQDVNKALDHVQNFSQTWVDPKFGGESKVYIKRNRGYQAREIGRFRRHFYMMLEDFLPKLPFYKDCKIDLKTIKGTMYAMVNDDGLGLLAFSRELIKDTNGIDPDYDNWKIIGVDKPKVDELVKAAVDAALASESR